MTTYIYSESGYSETLTRSPTPDNTTARFRPGNRENPMTNLDTITAELTAFKDFADMIENTHHDYRPTLRPDLDPRYADLADAYDREMARRGDWRRAYRGKGY